MTTAHWNLALLNRRDLLKAGLALPALGLAFAADAATEDAKAAGIGGGAEIDAFVVDRRHWPADKPLPHEATLYVVEGDMTNLWYDTLDLRWRQPGFVVAGRTGPDALFVLEQLAWSRGRRVTFRREEGEVVHWVISPVHPSLRA